MINAKRKALFMVTCLLLSIFFIPMVTTKQKRLSVDKYEPIKQVGNKSTVTWYLVQDNPFIYNISIQNTELLQKNVDISTIFDNTSFDIEDLTIRGFYEWKNTSHQVTTDIYEKQFTSNKTHTWVWDVKVGSDTNTVYEMKWIPVASSENIKTARSITRTNNNISFSSLGTRWYQLQFYTPMVNSSGRLALDVGGEVFDPWWNTTWLNKRYITIDNSASSENLENFTVLVHLDSSSMNWSKVQDDLDDFRFLDSDDSTPLYAELENYTLNDEAWIWVKLPQLDSTNATEGFFMYYNNVDATSAWDEENTWRSEWEGVWHFDEMSGDHDDSTVNDEDLTPLGSPDQDDTYVIDGSSLTAGQGSGDTYSGGDDADLECLGDWTMFWLGEINDDSNEGKLIAKTNNQANFPITEMAVEDDTGLLKMYIRWNTYTILKGTTDIFDEPTLAIGVRDHADTDKLYLYVNGTSDQTPETDDSGQADLSNNGPFYVSARYWGGTVYEALGRVDEARVYRGVLSSEWIEAEYLNCFSLWITIGGEQSAPSDSVTLTTPSDLEIIIEENVTITWRGSFNGTTPANATLFTNTTGTWTNTYYIGEFGDEITNSTTHSFTLPFNDTAIILWNIGVNNTVNTILFAPANYMFSFYDLDDMGGEDTVRGNALFMLAFVVSMVCLAIVLGYRRRSKND